jgi:hypothetical protein
MEKSKGKSDETLKKSGNASHTIKKKRERKPKVYKRKWGNQFDKLYEDADIETIADEMIEYFNKNKSAVHIVSFATRKKIRRETLYDFAKKNDYFAFCFKVVKDMIIDRVLKHGFSKGNNAAFPIFTLVNISEGEFVNKQDIKHSGSLTLGSIDTSKLTDEQLKTLRQKIQNREDKESIAAYLKVIGAL